MGKDVCIYYGTVLHSCAFVFNMQKSLNYAVSPEVVNGCHRKYGPQTKIIMEIFSKGRPMFEVILVWFEKL